MTLANQLTLSRVIIIPLLVLAMLYGGMVGQWLALMLYIYAAVTDYLDGYIARKTQTVSDFGKMLDPIADKLLIVGILLVAVAQGTVGGIHLWAVLIILCRELFVSGLREFLGPRNITISVTFVAKFKTTLQLIAVGFILAAPLLGLPMIVPVILVWVAAIFTLYTGIDYARQTWPILKG